jgi:hypothetical protein
MKRNEQLSLILGLLGKAAEALPDNELEKIARGTHSIVIKITRNRKNAKTISVADNINSSEIIKKLEEFSDRIIASNYLREIASNKKSLELIARHLDIALSKQDKFEDLINKIIESTVGARLRSSAIRGPEV